MAPCVRTCRNDVASDVARFHMTRRRRLERRRPPIRRAVKVFVAVAAVWLSALAYLVRRAPHHATLFLAASVLVFIVVNLNGGGGGGGGGERTPRARSAYSMFNENFESLPGAFTARDAEAVLRRGRRGGEDGVAETGDAAAGGRRGRDGSGASAAAGGAEAR